MLSNNNQHDSRLIDCRQINVFLFMDIFEVTAPNHLVDAKAKPSYNGFMALPSMPLPPIEDDLLWQLLAKAEEIGLRLEVTDVGIVWESMPGLRHQELLVQIFGAIQPSAQAGGCECYRALDVYIRFPSGVVKRPDISIFCKRPIDEEGFVHAIPEAVVEITSPESEAKDLVSGPPLYLGNGVKDVLIVHRSVGEVIHWNASGKMSYSSPVQLTLSCGCSVTV